MIFIVPIPTHSYDNILFLLSPNTDTTSHDPNVHSQQYVLHSRKTLHSVASEMCTQRLVLVLKVPGVKKQKAVALALIIKSLALDLVPSP